MRSRLAVVLAALLALPAAAAERHPEQQLIAAWESLQRGRLDEAWEQLEALVKRQPNFALARQFHRELDAARTGKAAAPAELDEAELTGLAEEARLRLHRRKPGDETLPDAVLQLAPGQTHAVVVDLLQARLYLIEQRDGELSVASDYFTSIGKEGIGKQRTGDNRTPVGVYRITDFIPGSRLADLYGAGAFPLDYPNVWDRRHGRTGQGIWLHGVPKATYVRAPRSSEGCVTLANADLMSLKPHLRLGQTPVVLSDAVEWLPRREWQQKRASLLEAVEDWRRRWSALDTEGYLAFYADDFTADGMDRAAFAAHKRRVNAGKSFVEVTLADLELYRYPGSEALWLARFTQHYRSDTFRLTTSKDQFWRIDSAGRWRIVAESNR